MKTVLMMVTISALFLGGCTTTTTSSGELNDNSYVLDEHGVPKQQFLIGSGVYMEFRAPEDGHIYLVDTNSAKNLITRPLDKGDSEDFEIQDFSEPDSEHEALLRKQGIDPDNMNIALYFIPNSQWVHKEKQAAFNENGLPKQEYYVGGGFSFNYTSDQAGTIYLVEKNSNTLVLTQSINANNPFHESINPSDDTLMKRFEILGIDTTNMAFGLYFVPLQ